MRLKLTYIRLPKGTKGCIEQSHYDLHTISKSPSNIACILTNKEGAKLIRKWVKKYNKEILTNLSSREKIWEK